MESYKTFIKIILIILGMNYCNSSLATHEKITSNWQDFILTKGTYMDGDKNHLIVAIMPIEGVNILYFRFFRDLDKKKDCEYMTTSFEISTHLEYSSKKSADEIIGKVIPIKIYDHQKPVQATILNVDKCPKNATHCFERAIIEIGNTKKVKQFDTSAVEKFKYNLRLFKHPDFDPNIYFTEWSLYTEWDLKHLSKLFKKVKLECKNTFKELSK